MKIIYLLLVLVALFPFGATLKAHSDHSHAPKKEVSTEVIASNASKYIDRMIKNKKLDVSWKSAKQISSEKKKFGQQIEWVVTFENGTIKDASKGKLYLFLSVSGDFIAANHTGK